MTTARKLEEMYLAHQHTTPNGAEIFTIWHFAYGQTTVSTHHKNGFDVHFSSGALEGVSVSGDWTSAPYCSIANNEQSTALAIAEALKCMAFLVSRESLIL